MRLVRFGAVIAAAAILPLLGGLAGRTVASSPSPHYALICATGHPLCTEVHDSEDVFGEDVYVGHDEPSVLFYSNAPGSGNSNLYLMTLPTDPPVLPKQDGNGGTFNFQLRPAFWFGMAMCDTQSFPEQVSTCTPDSDSNIVDPAVSPAHPGTAFMEMQFYPPGWVPWPAGASCDATKWCAALNIDSLSQNPVTGQVQNSTCATLVGLEYVNFAFITKSGNAQAPANPVQSTLATFTPDPAQDLFMNSGDILAVDMHDTAHGFTVIIHDLTSGQSGSMTASAANSFGQVKFDPTGNSCENIPYDFHPMYATSSEKTRVPWAAHSYNIAFSDEIGHFEYCANVSTPGGGCTSGGGAGDASPDADDPPCYPASASTRVQVGGCLGSDIDFDGVPYQTVWPGSVTNRSVDVRLHPRAVEFTSPLFRSGFAIGSYDRVAFETDLPRIEPTCNRSTGAGCSNPPPGASFYPIYTTHGGVTGCVWQLGGANIPGTRETFGGTSAAEYGPLLQLKYTSGSGTVARYNDYRQVLDHNPCHLFNERDASAWGAGAGTGQ